MFDLGVVLHVEIKSWSLLQVKGSNSGPLLNSFSIIYYLWGYRVAGNCIALYYWCCSKTLKKDHNQNFRSGAIYTSFKGFLPWLNFASPKFHFSCTCCFRALFKIYIFFSSQELLSNLSLVGFKYFQEPENKFRN